MIFSDNFLDHLLNEYKYSKPNALFCRESFNRNECPSYTPNTIGGICRFCLNKPINHRRWFEYSLNCIKIQNCWRISKIKEKIEKIKYMIIFKFGEDISEIICNFLLKQDNKTYKEMYLNYKTY